MLHKRRLGPKGMKIFKKFETQTGSWDLGLVRTGSVGMKCGIGWRGRLGPKGMKIFKKFETQIRSWDLGLVRT